MRKRTALPLQCALWALLASTAAPLAAQSAAEYIERERALNSGPERTAFIEAWQGRRVRLKDNLYSFIDSDPSNPNIRYSPAKPTYIAYGLTVVSPDKGTFLRHEYGRAINTDRDPQALLAKTGRERFMRLATYKSGTVLQVRPKRGVIFGEDRITLVLIDELDGGGPLGTTTDLIVQWPTTFAPTFTERSDVEKLIAPYLEPQ